MTEVGEHLGDEVDIQNIGNNPRKYERLIIKKEIANEHELSTATNASKQKILSKVNN